MRIFNAHAPQIHNKLFRSLKVVSRSRLLAGVSLTHMPARMAIVLALLLITGGQVACSLFSPAQNIQADSSGNGNTPVVQVQASISTDTVSPLPTQAVTETSPPTRDVTATSEPVQTSTASAPSPTDAPVVNDAAPPTQTLPPGNIEVASWDMKNFVVGTSGCRISGQDCFHGTDGDKTLTSSDSFFVDPNWPSPKLVFWHTYDFPENTQAYASIGVSGDWTPINYWKGSSAWKQTTIPLQEYSGKTIKVQFFAPFGVLRVIQKCEKTGHDGSKNCQDVQKIDKTDWVIQSVEIDPG